MECFALRKCERKSKELFSRLQSILLKYRDRTAEMEKKLSVIVKLGYWIHQHRSALPLSSLPLLLPAFPILLSPSSLHFPLHLSPSPYPLSLPLLLSPSLPPPSLSISPLPFSPLPVSPPLSILYCFKLSNQIWVYYGV